MLKPSPVARASALMYLDPFDILALKKNLRDKPMSPITIGMALAGVPSRAFETTVPKHLELVEMPFSAQTMLASGLRYWLEGQEVPYEMNNLVWSFKFDFERVLSGLKIAGPASQRDYYDVLGMMVLNGVPWNLIELIKIRGIGRKKALNLGRYGIKKVKDLVDEKNEVVVKNILKPKLYKDVISIYREGKVILQF